MHEETELAPRVRRTVQRVELGALGAVLTLLVLSGLAWTIGLTGSAGKPLAEGLADEAEERRTFRPLVADFRGTVEVLKAGKTAWRPLEWSDAFTERDRIRTGAKSVCDLMLTWGTGVRLLPDSELTWELLVRGAEDTRDVRVFLHSGRILASLDRLPDGSSFVVKTTHSEARVRGTVLSVSAEKQKTKVTVLSGVVEVVDVSDPSRKVRATTGTGVDMGRVERAAKLRPLSAAERAKLLGEQSSVDRGVKRLSPGLARSKVEARKVNAKAAAPRPTRSSGPKVVEVEKPPEIEEGGDEAEVRDVLQAGLLLISQGNVQAALAYTTSTFRAMIWGPMATRAGAPKELSRKQGGDQSFLVARDRIAGNATVHLKVRSLEVTLEGDVAYGAAVIDVTAVPTNSRRRIERVYSCSARLLKRKGRWRVDLATATEGKGKFQ